MSLLDAAIAYARIGWHVFPCAPPIAGDKTSGKQPLTKNGKDDATTNEAMIRAWWHRWPNANIGVATLPSNLIVLDVDTKNGKKGLESLREIDSELTPTLTQRTGSGAYHFVYQRGEHPARQALNVRDGLDILGNGYFIAAPSVHYTGGTYAWANNTPIAPCPPVLVNMKRVRDEKPVASAPPVVQREGMPSEQERVIAAARIAGAFPAKGRHMAFLALAGGLATDGWDETSIAEFCTMVAKLLPYETAEDREKAMRDRPLQAHDSVSRVQAGLTVEGWGALSHMMDREALRGAMDSLHLTDRDFDNALREATELARGALGESSLAFVLENTPVQPEAAERGFTLIEELAAIEYPPVVSYPTGFKALDELLGGGFSTQQLIVMLGKPGAGKSAFVIGRALHCESNADGAPVLYVSTELQHNEIVARAASPLVEAPWRDIVRGKAIAPDGSRITHHTCYAALRGRRIAVIGQDEIYRAGEGAVKLIASTAIAMKRAYGKSPIIIVDYMQELARGDATKQRAQNTAVAVAFRMLSQSLDAAIVAISSVSRQGYGAAGAALRETDDPTAYLSLAKESGDIDYAAATIAFVDVADDRDADGWRPGRIAVAKSRHGEVGFAGVRFHGATGRWEDFADGVAMLSGEKQKQSRQEKQMAEYEKRVMDKVRELRAYGRDQLLDKTRLKMACGGNGSMMGVAIENLIQKRSLVTLRTSYPDALGRLQTKEVIDLAEGFELAAPGPATPTPDPIKIGEIDFTRRA